MGYCTDGLTILSSGREDSSLLEHSLLLPLSPERDWWRKKLFARLRGNPYPLFVFDEVVIPAASIWSGARLWIKAFREAGLCEGDRIVLALPPSAGFVQVLVAALWEGYTLAFTPPTDNPQTIDALMETVDARCAIAHCSRKLGVIPPQSCEGPSEAPIALRRTRFAPTPEIRFLLKTSGSRSKSGGRWVALSDRNIVSVLESHLNHLGMKEQETKLLSVLPWHHAFGLILDLLPGLLSGVDFIRDAQGGKNPTALLSLAQESGVTHFSSVPIVLKRLLALPGGAEFLQSLEGGIVGGAAVDAELATFLATTRLRAGYGQTEASPGITLGSPGHWPGANYIGLPMGCKTQVCSNGVLWFSGDNACYGFWEQETGQSRNEPTYDLGVDVTDWRSTGDIVSANPHGHLFFQGRADDTFKLTNGRRVEAGVLETQLKQYCSGMADSVLFSPEGESLVLLWTGYSDNRRPSPKAIDAVLGGLRPRLAQMIHIPYDTWPRTGKGTVDRQSLVSQYNNQHL